MLSLISTPIGNLKDITQRALEKLSSCDYILCEDTRRTRILLNHYGIKTPLKSFHKFSEAKKEGLIIDELQEGKMIALVSDAGTPAIADPGVRLVMRCRQEGIEVETIPGPCALIAAVSISGFATHRFQFVGFLPRKSGQLKKQLEEILAYEGTTICYESPYRLVKVLQALAEIDPEKEVAVARELTKKFEELYKGPCKKILEHYSNKPPKGEIVLIL